MKTVLTNESAMIPSDDERKKIFFWLQRISSVTAWQRILDLYKVWAASVESSVQVAELNGWHNKASLKRSTYIAIMKCVAHCEKAVSRLQRGDKRVFKFDTNGDFEMGGRSLGHWSTMIERLEIGENGISVKTPLWPQFCDSLLAAATAWGECGPYILEPRYLDEPGLILYGVWLERKLKEFPVIEELPAVPNPSDEVFVRTNDFTPFFGIWEPIGSFEGSTAGLLDFLKRTANPSPPFKIAGAMSYLHGGSRAPRITIETSDDNIDMNTVWRLLWRDNRYEDGTIPEIE